MPVVDKALTNKAMTDTYARSSFPGALEMMILESLRREPGPWIFRAHIGRYLTGPEPG